MKTQTVCCAFFCAWVGWLADLPRAGSAEPDGPLNENFDQYPPGESLEGQKAWKAFAGFRGTPPRVEIVPKMGKDGSAALAVAHPEAFRGDNWGLIRQLPQAISEGVIWAECDFYPPEDWKADFFFDLRSDRAVVARVSAAKYQNKDQPVLRAHAAWTYSYWRIYRQVPLKAEWYRFTMRVDLDKGTYAAWVNDQPLGEELSLCSREPIRQVYVSLAGGEKNSARIDNLQIRRTPPADGKWRELLPDPESDLSFRMAVVGDPQIGFTGYEADLRRFQQSVEQINESKAELTLIMGDMVHENDHEPAYKDIQQAAKKLTGPCYFVRGNHDRLDLYQKYFHPQADFAVRHKGWRFVFLDAIGNLRGLKDEQLAFAEKELQQAKDAGEHTGICLHVSPWQDNEKGRGAYNQIGPGRDRLVELLDKYHVKFCLSGHYHRGLWHVQKQATHYMVFGGTGLVKQGWLGWCIFDVYPDRVVVHQKPVYFAYERPDAEAFYNFNYSVWTPYEEAHKKYPYLQRGPAVIPLGDSASPSPGK